MIHLVLPFIFVSTTWFAAFAEPKDKCQHDEKTFRCVKVLRVYDGDTIYVDIPDTHPLFGKNMPVRIRGIDTPEIRTRDHKCEKPRGLEAKKYLEGLVRSAKSIELRNIGRPKYFRVLADLYLDREPVSRKLIDRGLAYEYHGKTKQKIDWCRTKRVPASNKKPTKKIDHN